MVVHGGSKFSAQLVELRISDVGPAGPGRNGHMCIYTNKLSSAGQLRDWSTRTLRSNRPRLWHPGPRPHWETTLVSGLALESTRALSPGHASRRRAQYTTVWRTQYLATS